jgi:hypothetical protein
VGRLGGDGPVLDEAEDVRGLDRDRERRLVDGGGEGGGARDAVGARRDLDDLEPR